MKESGAARDGSGGGNPAENAGEEEAKEERKRRGGQIKRHGGKKRGYLIQQAPTRPSAHQTRQLNWASEREHTLTHTLTHAEQRANKIQ